MNLLKFLWKDKIIIIASLIGIWYPLVYTLMFRFANETVSFFSLGNIIFFLIATSIILILYSQIQVKKDLKKLGGITKEGLMLFIIFLYQVIMFGGLILSLMSTNLLITLFTIVILVCLFVLYKYMNKNPYLLSVMLFIIYYAYTLINVFSMNVRITILYSGYMIILNIITLIVSITFALIYKKKIDANIKQMLSENKQDPKE